jgi:iron complex transport system substrate-binding protein
VAQYFENETRFANVGAIKNHRVYVIDSDTIDRAGPRIVDALEIVAGDIRTAGTATPVTSTTSPAAPGFETAPALGALAIGFIVAVRRIR